MGCRCPGGIRSLGRVGSSFTALLVDRIGLFQLIQK